MFKNLGRLKFLGGVATGATATVLYQSKDQLVEKWSPQKPTFDWTVLKKPYHAAVPIPANRPTDIMQFGFPGNTNLKLRQNYVLSYDTRNKNPIWVFEHLTKENTCKTENSCDRDNFDFCEDQTIVDKFRATNKDFKRSGFDRGHLAAAANHRAQAKWMEETFLLSNISPQTPALNQILWNNLERYTRSLCHHFEDVYVCSGPLYLPHREGDNKLYVKYQVLEPNHVAVPTHFFKVIACQKRGNFDVLCYVMPNTNITNPDQPIDNFLTPLDSVEKASGLTILPALPKDKIRRMNKNKC